MCVFVNLRTLNKARNMKNMIIASTSTLHGGSYLEYILAELELHFRGCKSIIFVPYARPGGITHQVYTDKVKEVFSRINIVVNGIHEFETPVSAIKEAEGIFIGGGNTFLLVSKLYENCLMTEIAAAVKKGVPYFGTSAGSNITGMSMQTTNDMPIIYPPTFQTLGLIPFNINPHYLDPDPDSKHMGETREMRIKEFHEFNSLAVVGLREGSWLDVKGDIILLKGHLNARLFRQYHSPIEIESGYELSLLE